MASRAWRWCWDRGVLFVGLTFFAGMAFSFFRHVEDGEWHTCYARAAQRMQAGETIHRNELTAYAYPPAMALLSVPLANLTPRASLVAWYLVNVGAGCAVFVFAWRLVGGPRLVRLAPRWQAVFWLGFLLSLRFLQGPWGNQQFDTAIAALLFWGCWQLWRGRELWAGAGIGAAAAMKCTPLLFVPYLIFRGKWRGAAAACCVAAALNLAPDVLYPQLSGASYLADWKRSFLGEVGQRAPGAWFSDLQLNQSLAGLFNRLAQMGAGGRPNADAPLAPATVAALRWATYGVCALSMLATAWRFGAPFRSVPDGAKHAPGTHVPWYRLRVAVEASALVCLMLLASPMSSKAHYVVLLLPSLVLARGLVEGRSRTYWRLLAPLALLGPLTAKDITGKVVGEWLLMWGGPTWFVCLLLIAMWLAPIGRRASRKNSCHAPPPSFGMPPGGSALRAA